VPEVNQYFFSHQELVTVLLKQAGLHEGRWQLIVNFGFGASNIQVGPNEALPGGTVIINKVGLQRAAPDSPESLVVDAAVVNPAQSKPIAKK
jgi:hypothetical protein